MQRTNTTPATPPQIDDARWRALEGFGIEKPSLDLSADLNAHKRVLLQRGMDVTQVVNQPDIGTNVMCFIASSDGIKRDGNEIDNRGWQFDNFARNPVFLFAHDYSTLPIGKHIDWKVEADGNGGSVLRIWTQFVDGETYPFAERVRKLYEGGFLRAVSVGWAPITYEPRMEGDLVAGWRFLTNDLLEVSAVPVPADPRAIIEAVQQRVLKPEDMDTFARWAKMDKATGGIGYTLSNLSVGSKDTKRDDQKVNGLLLKEEPETIVPLKRDDNTLVVIDEATGVYAAAVAAVMITPYKVPEGFSPTRRTPRPDPEYSMVGWNTTRAFDITREKYDAAYPELGIVARYLDCEIRDLWQSSDSIPPSRTGSFLTALDETIGDWIIDDTRRLDSSREGRVTELPPVFETMQLNSTESREFMTNGTRFMRSEEAGMVVTVQPSWYGYDIRMFALRAKREVAQKFLTRTWERASQINYLKGEAFALSGEFLERGEEGWDDLFLDEKNFDAVTRQVALINERGAALSSRGIILMGPPGTGKTLAGRIMMNRCKDATFVWVSARDLYYSGAFGGIEHAFAVARECAPAILFFEDIDNSFNERTIDLLKTTMDGIKQRGGVTTVLTTNFPERLPKALLDRPGRFHDVLKLDLPNAAARTRMLAKWLPDLATDEVRTKIVEQTEGYSGAHMRELANYVSTLREQDSLELDDAVERALTKITEQRDLINEALLGKSFKPSRELEAAMTRTLAMKKNLTQAREAVEGELIPGELVLGEADDRVLEAIRELGSKLDSLTDVLTRHFTGEQREDETPETPIEGAAEGGLDEGTEGADRTVITVQVDTTDAMASITELTEALERAVEVQKRIGSKISKDTRKTLENCASCMQDGMKHLNTLLAAPDEEDEPGVNAEPLQHSVDLDSMLERMSRAFGDEPEAAAEPEVSVEDIETRLMRLAGELPELAEQEPQSKGRCRGQQRQPYRR